MLRRTTHFVIVTASFVIGANLTTSAAAAPVNPIEPSQAVAPAAEQASFWALPYPYGYTYRTHSCIRHVRVETRYGWRWKRVWVCN